MLTQTFEGIEKKLCVNFSGEGDLRTLGAECWGRVVKRADASILSVAHAKEMDLYLLSESSLFVLPKSVIVKTCGKTRLLNCLPLLLRLAATIGGDDETKTLVPSSLRFARSSYMFPDEQRCPHTSLDEEIAQLRKLFPDGVLSTLGSGTGLNWHVFTVSMGDHLQQAENLHDEKAVSDFQGLVGSPTCLDVAMFDCDEAQAMKARPVHGVLDALHASSDAFDEHFFEPFGYSCNACVSGSHYADVHVTPQKCSSYISYEINTEASTYAKWVFQCLDTYRPRFFSILVSTSHVGNKNVSAKARATDLRLHAFPGYSVTEVSRVIQCGSLELLCVSYAESSIKAPLEHPAARYFALAPLNPPAPSSPAPLLIIPPSTPSCDRSPPSPSVASCSSCHSLVAPPSPALSSSSSCPSNTLPDPCLDLQEKLTA